MASANQFRAEIWGVSHRHRPLRGDGEVPAATRASGAQRSVCASGWEGREEIGAEIIPKGVINAGQSLSHGEAVTAPFTQGSLRDGGCGLPRRPCGPPRNDNGFLSFRGAERRGNPSFLRWTMDGGSGRPTKDEGRHAGSSCPTGGCGEPPRLPWPAAHSGASAPAGAREGWESTQGPSQKGDRRRDRPGSA